ncbi:MAG: hypothetical protein Ct9H300mP25_05530 [Acidobacteriota bacterium]|nr:MAG: hypothetical protein Ct9H300mP25_05530 [Acidobacteriota bacterium]
MKRPRYILKDWRGCPRLKTLPLPAAIGTDAEAALRAAEYLLEHEPRHSSMLRTSISPTIIDGGYQVNVIPGEAVATLDVRMLPDEDPAALLETLRNEINDPTVTVSFIPRDTRPVADNGPLDSQPFEIIQSMLARHYEATKSSDDEYWRD